jgi:hypothetical protein
MSFRGRKSDPCLPLLSCLQEDDEPHHKHEDEDTGRYPPELIHEVSEQDEYHRESNDQRDKPDSWGSAVGDKLLDTQDCLQLLPAFLLQFPHALVRWRDSISIHGAPALVIASPYLWMLCSAESHRIQAQRRFGSVSRTSGSPLTIWFGFSRASASQFLQPMRSSSPL